jgi:hypothetical protein
MIGRMDILLLFIHLSPGQKAMHVALQNKPFFMILESIGWLNLNDQG